MKYAKIEYMDFLCTHCQQLSSFQCIPKYWGEKFWQYVEKYSVSICPKCGFRLPPVYIDPDIADSIAKLNRMNLFTRFCCSGHINPHRKIGIPYVAFDSELPKEILDTLPESWYVDTDSNAANLGTTIRAHAEKILEVGLPVLPLEVASEYKNYILPKAIHDFNDWVNNLHGIEPIYKNHNTEIVDFIMDEKYALARANGKLYVITTEITATDDAPGIYAFGYDELCKPKFQDADADCKNALYTLMNQALIELIRKKSQSERM